MNRFGNSFTLTDFGESHGKAIGGIVDGCPPGIDIDIQFIQNELNRRAPSSMPHSTQRHEPDKVQILSGIYQGKTTGAPIGFIINNEDVQIDEKNLKVLKPSHASFVYKEKYGHQDNFPVGRASARLTACIVVAGAIAKLLLRPFNISFETYVLESGTPTCEGDTVGVKVGCCIRNLPSGLGEPLYDKFDARLAYAMMSLNAAKGFEIGKGLESARMSGTAYIDRQTDNFQFLSNHDGGVQAGITNGQEVIFAVAFKPIPAIRIEQKTLDFQGNPALYKASNRNDLCVAPRIFPVIEATAAIVVADFILQSKHSKYFYGKN